MDFARRDLLALSGLAFAGAMLEPSAVRAQTPKRGGTLTLRVWDPPHFDPYLVVAFKTQVVYSFTHSRLLKHRAGPSVQPGSFVLEGDLAESWSQPNETTYVFRLRKGVRWHPKPPTNGRELTADDVVYSMDRFRNLIGNPQNYLLGAVERVEATDRHTVKVTLKEPYVWFPDVVANPMTGAIVAREVVEKFGDLKKWEATVGTGPWMLDSYRPNIGMTLVRNPHYFVPGLPYIDRVELVVDEDQASRMAAFLAKKYDLGPEFMGVVNRPDWNQFKDQLAKHRPGLRTVDLPSNVRMGVTMRSDRPPFNDVRVRRALSMALNRQALVEAVADGAAVFNPPGLPIALKEWSLAIDQLGEGARYYQHDPAEARRLLAQAGYPKGFSTVIGAQRIDLRVSHAGADIATRDAHARGPVTPVHALPAVDDETIDAEILDARDVPDEPHDGVRPGMRSSPELSLRKAAGELVPHRPMELRITNAEEVAGPSQSRADPIGVDSSMPSRA